MELFTSFITFFAEYRALSAIHIRSISWLAKRKKPGQGVRKSTYFKLQWFGTNGICIAEQPISKKALYCLSLLWMPIHRAGSPSHEMHSTLLWAVFAKLTCASGLLTGHNADAQKSALSPPPSSPSLSSSSFATLRLSSRLLPWFKMHPYSLRPLRLKR